MTMLPNRLCVHGLGKTDERAVDLLVAAARKALKRKPAGTTAVWRIPTRQQALNGKRARFDSDVAPGYAEIRCYTVAAMFWGSTIYENSCRATALMALWCRGIERYYLHCTVRLNAQGRPSELHMRAMTAHEVASAVVKLIDLSQVLSHTSEDGKATFSWRIQDFPRPVVNWRSCLAAALDRVGNWSEYLGRGNIPDSSLRQAIELCFKLLAEQFCEELGMLDVNVCVRNRGGDIYSPTGSITCTLPPNEDEDDEDDE